jgi:thiosulfate dehydrogenase [quinone] large subunit
MTVHRLETNMLGHEVAVDYSAQWLGYAVVFMRIAMGWILFQGGITKVLDPSWSAAGFLLHGIPEGNPLAGMFASMAGNPMIDFLNAWGLTLTGLGLMLGALVRWNAFWGAIMMLFYWAASLTGGISEFFPIAHGWFVDDHMVYAVLLFGLGAFGAGRILGVDAYLEKSKVVKGNGWLKVLLG